MKIRHFSDLHIEFQRGTREVWLPPVLPDDKDTVLVLAGDIDVGKHTATYVNRLGSQFKAVVFVLGNHDMYGENIDKVYDKISGLITEDNVHLLQNSKVTIEDTEFLGSTLWTDIAHGDPFLCFNAKNTMMDFRKIKKGPGYSRFTTAVWLYQNRISRAFLKQHVDIKKKQVVVTHHAPDFACAGTRYNPADSKAAYYYNNGMGETIADAGLWIYGHTHQSFDGYLGNTRVVHNPFGYWTKREEDTEKDFNYFSLIEY
jgi:predicted MPP superfamily phosphohydrolase